MKFSDSITQSGTQNISWINNLRLIAMFAVIVLHTASPLLFKYADSPLNWWMAADIYNAAVRFAVPVFVMITGALLLHRKYELTDFLKKRISRLIIPFLFWSLIYIAYRWNNEEFYFTKDAWTNIRMVLHNLKLGSYYHLWYVYLLFSLYLFIPILSSFVRNATEKEILYFLAIWFITMLINKPYFTRFDTAIDLHNFAGYIGYLVLGHYLAYKQFCIRGLLFITVVLFVAFTAIIATGTYYLEVEGKGLSTLFYEPIGPFVLVLSASAFLIAKHTVVKLNPTVNKVMNNASKYTLGIYLSHALVLNGFELMDVHYTILNPALSIPLIALVCFAIAWLLIYILSKLPLIKYVVG
ncbi:acyltransferase family protein [Mucilaginibacter sp. RB4R14]|uniref:acyltransferase n=1 Tax=Mucilaginibacter aurantiaciroseus TaxID=2949308 RepID=UPI002090FE5E|nr:acyltransferase family protein [Mucilaginibacter aurantiaciroseus]MCO5936439.1 acyltransferase family protein [Mucilaginibacter aurantiaciroseus]